MKRGKEKKSKIDEGTIYAITLIFFASILINLFTQYPALTNRFVLNHDVLQTTMYLQSCHDKELFQGDLLAKIKIQQAWPSIKFVYCTLNFFFPIEMISKILPFILCFITALYLFRIGREIRSNSLGILIALIFLFYSQTINNSFVGGQMRAFGITFLPMFLYYLIKKEYIKVSLVICLTMFFYPPLVLIFLLTYFMSIIEHKKNFVFCFKNKRVRNIFFFCIALIIISAFISLSSYSVVQKYSNIQDLLNHKSFFTYEEVMHMPEFDKHGRASSWAQAMNVSAGYIFSSEFINNNIFNFGENGQLFHFLTLFLLICSLAFWMLLGYKVTKIPKELWFMLLSSFLLFSVVYFTHPFLSYLLYLAPRYLSFTLPLFLSLFVSINLNEFLEKTKNKKIVIVFIVGISLILLPFYINMFEYHLESYDYSELYNFLSTLPKNSLIAGHPYQMDAVPLFAKRSVLVNFRSTHPAEIKEYWSELKNRTYDVFAAIYTTKQQEFNNFCKKYDVDYFVVDKFYYSNEYLSGREMVYSKPFDSYIKNITYEKKETDFYLFNIHGNKKVWESTNGTIFVVACDKV